MTAADRRAAKFSWWKGALPLALLLAGLAWFGGARVAGRDAPDAAEGPSPAPAPVQAPAPVAANDAPDAARASAADLPALGVPFAKARPELERLAAAGVPEAACRLAAEAMACGGLALRREQHLQWLATRRRQLEETARTNERGAVGDFAANFEREARMREGWLDAMARHCEGAPTVAPIDLLRQWQRAARLGSPSAMRHYASGSAFRWEAMLDAGDVLQAYRGEAEAMALALARDGDLPMLLQLAGASAPVAERRRSLLGQVVDEDPALALALYERALAALEARQAAPDVNTQRLVEDIRGRIELVRELSTPDQLAEASRRALALASWRPVEADGYPGGASVHGMRVNPTPAACQGFAAPPGRLEIR